MADLKWIEDFLDLAKTRNFTQTAENRFVTQPALSRRIRHLEDWVGSTLFDRNSKPIQLTAEGELFKVAAHDVLGFANAIRGGLTRGKPARASDQLGIRAATDTHAAVLAAARPHAVEDEAVPAQQDDVVAMPVPVEPAATRDKEALGRIVVVDDSAVSLSVLNRVIERMGHQPIAFADGREALDHVVSTPADIVLTDCEMPDFDGYALTKAIRSTERGGNRRTPIVAVTRHTSLKEIDHCFDVGMDDYLGKPVGRDELEVVLNRWLTTDETVEGVEKTRLAGTVPDDSADDSEAATLLRTFCTTMRERIERIAGLIEDGDPVQVAADLPGLKSEAFMVGAYSFGRNCGQLQKAATAGTLALMLEKRGPFLASFVQLERAIRCQPG